MAQITLKGNTIHTNGNLPHVGEKAHDFHLLDDKLHEKTLKDFKGKKIIYAVPSLDTPTCSVSTKKFAHKIENHPEISVIVVSCDLPFAQARVCGTEHIKNVHTLSMMRSKKFAEDYGIMITDGPIAGLCARAVIVLDEHNKVLHTELVSEVANEPDYEKAFRVFNS